MYNRKYIFGRIYSNVKQRRSPSERYSFSFDNKLIIIHTCISNNKKSMLYILSMCLFKAITEI